MPILATIKKYATLIKWGGIIILVAGVVYAVYDYSQSKEQLSQLQDSNEILENRLEDVKGEIEEQTRRLTLLREDYRQIENEYSRQLEQINELRELTAEYIITNKPEIEKEINERYESISREIQCLTGDSSKCES